MSGSIERDVRVALEGIGRRACLGCWCTSFPCPLGSKSGANISELALKSDTLEAIRQPSFDYFRGQDHAPVRDGPPRPHAEQELRPVLFLRCRSDHRIVHPFGGPPQDEGFSDA
jgi:hypothetical protein